MPSLSITLVGPPLRSFEQASERARERCARHEGNNDNDLDDLDDLDDLISIIISPTPPSCKLWSASVARSSASR